MTEMTRYQVQVGRAWVTLDFKVGAVDVDFEPGQHAARTVEACEGTVLLDYGDDGHLIAVEVLTGIPETSPERRAGAEAADV